MADELGQATFFSAVRGRRTSDTPTPAGDGPPRLTVTLPDRTALDNLAQTLAKLLLVAEAGK